MTVSPSPPPSPPRTRIRPAAKTTDFSAASYWANRFESERSFEWLASSATICPMVYEAVRSVRAYHRDRLTVVTGARRDTGGPSMDRVKGGEGRKRPRLNLLHFGCGTSSLGRDVQAYLNDKGEWVTVTDADYVADSIRTDAHEKATPSIGAAVDGTIHSATDGETDMVRDRISSVQRRDHASAPEVRMENGQNGRLVRLINLDVLNPRQLEATKPRDFIQRSDELQGSLESLSIDHGAGPQTAPRTNQAGDDECMAKPETEGWDIILDKSTADAISCGPDIPLSTLYPSLSSRSAPEDQDLEFDMDEKIEPILALCDNLAHVVRTGGRWVCISYSATRFDHLKSESLLNDAQAGIAGSVQSRNAQSGATNKGHVGGAAGPRWRLVSQTPVLDGFGDADEKEKDNGKDTAGKDTAHKTKVVYAPEVNVWAYVLERI